MSRANINGENTKELESIVRVRFSNIPRIPKFSKKGKVAPAFIRFEVS